MTPPAWAGGHPVVSNSSLQYLLSFVLLQLIVNIKPVILTIACWYSFCLNWTFYSLIIIIYNCENIIKWFLMVIFTFYASKMHLGLCKSCIVVVFMVLFFVSPKPFETMHWESPHTINEKWPFKSFDFKHILNATVLVTFDWNLWWVCLTAAHNMFSICT